MLPISNIAVNTVKYISRLSSYDTFINNIVKVKGAHKPWVFTIPELDTHPVSSALLPWKHQIPMTVRYSILDKDKNAGELKPIAALKASSSTLPRIINPVVKEEIFTPNGIAVCTDITAPTPRRKIVRDQAVNKYKYEMRIRSNKVTNNRPKPLTTQRIRRRERRLQKIWDTKTKERENAIIRRREALYKAEKRRVSASDWWDWYLPYDNPPRQF